MRRRFTWKKYFKNRTIIITIIKEIQNCVMILMLRAVHPIKYCANRKLKNLCKNNTGVRRKKNIYSFICCKSCNLSPRRLQLFSIPLKHETNAKSLIRRQINLDPKLLFCWMLVALASWKINFKLRPRLLKCLKCLRNYYFLYKI